MVSQRSPQERASCATVHAHSLEGVVWCRCRGDVRTPASRCPVSLAASPSGPVRGPDPLAPGTDTPSCPKAFEPHPSGVGPGQRTGVRGLTPAALVDRATWGPHDGGKRICVGMTVK